MICRWDFKSESTAVKYKYKSFQSKPKSKSSKKVLEFRLKSKCRLQYCKINSSW